MARFDNRYSQFVAWVKIALPLGALGLLSSLALFSRNIDPETAIPFAAVDVEELARQQGMGNPTFTGTLADGSPYRFTATTARPRVGDFSVVDADRVEATVDTQDGTEVTVNAQAGVFDGSVGRFDLTGAVRVATSSNVVVASEAMTLLTEESRLFSEIEVAASADAVELTAGSMRVFRDAAASNGYVLRFENGVRLIYSP